MKTSFWKLLSHSTIEIPVIQRDYAQGRKDEEIIANAFITKIKNKLTNKSPLNLDFVYGKQVNQKITPLDGQQRLTTLFLLHWYFAMKEEKYTNDIKNKLSKFSYETRISSRDFCKNLIEKSLSEFTSHQSVSKQIENESWFFLSWKNDPTISAMLHMLDIIHDHFKNEELTFLESLLDQENLITFNYLSLDQFKLTDELYIKMNSRGKPLTDFENFKSLFSSLLDFDQKSKLDNEWYDIFWQYESEKEIPDTENIDQYFFNFFENMTLCFCLEDHDLTRKEYEKFNLFDDFKSVFYRNSPYLHSITDSLNAVKGSKINTQYLQTGIQHFKKTSYYEKLKLYSFIIFLIKKGSTNSFNEKQFQKWMRICSNLINNTLIQSIDEFTRAIRGIKQLSKGIDDIYTYLTEDNKVSGFNEIQQKEEAVKAKLIIQDALIWEQEIYSIEANSYFDGQIGFILELSKSETEYEINIFKEYTSKLNFLFGILKDGENFIFQRALFATGNYLIKIGNARTFCNFDTNLRSKMDNWRKVFSDKIDILKTLLDSFSVETYKNDFAHLITKNNYTDWKAFFVKEPILLQRADNYQIKTEGGIFLARSTASGWQKKGEMNSFLLHHKFLTNPIYPFTNSEYFDTAYETPCAYIDHWMNKDINHFALDISYNEGFIFSFFDRYGNQFPDEIIQNLNNYDFKIENKRFVLRTEIKDIENAYQFIVDFCENFT